MDLLKLILTNLRRHRVRTSMGVAGIAFGVSAMLTIITVLQGAIHMFERILSHDSEMVVFEKNVSDLFFSNVPTGAVEAMNDWEMVSRADPVLFGIVSTPGNPVVTCFGVREEDARLGSATWVEGSRAAFAGRETIILGERAKEFLNAELNGEVEIGQAQFRVGGVIRTSNGFEDGGVFMRLDAAQDFFHKPGVVSVATIKLKEKEAGDEFKEQVARDYPGLMALENEEFSRSYSQFKILKTTAWAAGGCAFLLGGLSVANTMVMSVFTRIREIAVLRVCGFSRWQVVVLILGESLMVSLGGVLAGVTLSFAGMKLLKSLPLLQGYVESQMDWPVLFGVIALAGCTALAGAAYPAAYGARVRAVEALRFE